jgi:hypothetical protein
VKAAILSEALANTFWNADKFSPPETYIAYKPRTTDLDMTYGIDKTPTATPSII